MSTNPIVKNHKFELMNNIVGVVLSVSAVSDFWSSLCSLSYISLSVRPKIVKILWR
jgi:hypothetical protein